jgi:hypothetical protein
MAEGSPHSLERAGRCVQHQHARVAVSVRHDGFAGWSIDEHVGGPFQVLRVPVSAARAPRADLPEEFSCRRELQQHVVGSLGTRCARDRVDAADPHVIAVVHEDAVLDVWPVILIGRPAPGAHHLSLGIEFQHRRGSMRLLLGGHGAGSVQHPDVVSSINGHPRWDAHDPPVWQLRRPRAIHFEGGHARRCSDLRTW